MKVEDSAALWDKVLAAAPNTTNTFVAEIDGRVVGFASGMQMPEAQARLRLPSSRAIYLVREASARASAGASSPRSRPRSARTARRA